MYVYRHTHTHTHTYIYIYKDKGSQMSEHTTIGKIKYSKTRCL